ncbi:MAG: hypothetical protein P8L47_04065 [Candidatus Marinamargulisbacteria bacterium]|nr:hypothetical protein [Candidatus Marinamargulisbacteria bacterium]
MIGLVSNGYGEDAIAASIAQAWSAQGKTAIVAVALVGDGAHYRRVGVIPAATFPVLPSGGFVRSIRQLVGDVGSGLVRVVIRQRRAIYDALEHADRVIVVGDVWALGLTRWALGKPVWFLPTAKSHRFMRHSWLECWCMRRWCLQVFPRDRETADELQAVGISADYMGSPIMTLPPPADTVPNGPRYIGVLPGSRNEAYTNLAKIMAYLSDQLGDYRLLIGAPPQLDANRLHAIAPNDAVWTHDISTVIENSGVIIGMAGTANEQAAVYGRTVLVFPGTGPQTTAKRFQEQVQLMGDRIQYVVDDPATVCAAVLQYWEAPSPIDWSVSGLFAQRIVWYNSQPRKHNDRHA